MQIWPDVKCDGISHLYIPCLSACLGFINLILKKMHLQAPTCVCVGYRRLNQPRSVLMFFCFVYSVHAWCMLVGWWGLLVVKIMHAIYRYPALDPKKVMKPITFHQSPVYPVAEELTPRTPLRQIYMNAVIHATLMYTFEGGINGRCTLGFTLFPFSTSKITMEKWHSFFIYSPIYVTSTTACNMAAYLYRPT